MKYLILFSLLTFHLLSKDVTSKKVLKKIEVQNENDYIFLNSLNEYNNDEYIKTNYESNKDLYYNQELMKYGGYINIEGEKRKIVHKLKTSRGLR